MQISSISELGQIDEQSLVSSNIFTDDVQTNREYMQRIIGNRRSSSNFLIEASVPDGYGDYDSVRIQYERFLSSTVIPSVKGFLNRSNGMVSSDMSTDYNMDDIFNYRQQIFGLSAFDTIFSENVRIRSELESLRGIIEQLSSKYATIESLSADNVVIPTKNNASINGMQIVNEIIGKPYSETGISVIAERGEEQDSLNKYYINVAVDYSKANGRYDSFHVPVGAIVPFIGDFPQTGDTINQLRGFIKCNGQSVSPSQYPDLFNVIGYRFGKGESNQFIVPNLNDGHYLVGLTSYNGKDARTGLDGSYSYGAFLDEALPNISGEFIVDTENVAIPLRNIDGNDAFYGSLNKGGVGFTNPVAILSAQQKEIRSRGIVFDAQRGQLSCNIVNSSNKPIYGKDDKYHGVRPKSMTVAYYIKAAYAKSDFTDWKDDILSALSTIYLPNWYNRSSLVGGIYDPEDEDCKPVSYQTKISDVAQISSLNLVKYREDAEGKKYAYVDYNKIYPVGSIYITVDDRNPTDLFPGTTWERFSRGRFLEGSDENDDARKTAGYTMDSALPFKALQDLKGFFTIGYGAMFNYSNGSFIAEKNGSQDKFLTEPAVVGDANQITFDPSHGQDTYEDFSSNKKAENKWNQLNYFTSDRVHPPSVIVHMWRRIS